MAIIMDGNGRWAALRGLPRIEGHRKGAETLRRVVELCPELGVDILTVFAFSTENWRRPKTEVTGLMALLRRYLRQETAELEEKGVRVRMIGDRRPLDADIVKMIDALEARTAHCVKHTLVVALNYGGRAEIAAAARRLASEVASGARSIESIDEAAMSSALFTDDLPDPDLVIRTSGERRISNFLLWQSAYSELVFAPEFWPDFDRAAFERALSSFAARERRFGALGR